MKHFKRILFIVLIAVGISSLNAQDANNPWVIEIGTNAVDFYPTGADADALGNVPDGQDPYIGDMFEDFFNYDDHWNTASIISRLRVGRYLGSGFSLGLAGSFNQIDKIGDYKVEDLSYFGLDLDVRFRFLYGWFDKYLLAGGG